ncbi:DNA-binding GntR family transcriptional regulator [Microbacterium keratanolyticum]|uniref:GntR family transcriptional regulator n=1 Tax=Microbacterium keratanolyticum TaxID=67574 RepID=A0A9W6HRV1_9MICO|nr:GntR family transcriptional regulator [Microbacterium keratanolyticum]MBM7469418.1 DNA-binding GntR family transcriptional regulator [Microbacterium keratanolyticum]GLK01499.1 GntR family transcriptional regulator [Microbacterium keratanolyticum]
MDIAEGTPGGKKLLADEVFDRLAHSIIDGTLQAGERIRDAELAASFNMSRMPIREALQRLERIGMVVMYPSRFTQVTEVTPEVSDASLEFAGYLSGSVAHMSVPKLTSTEREHAASLVDAMISSIGNAKETSNARWAMFDYLGARTGNPLVRSVQLEYGIAMFRNLSEWHLTDEQCARMREVTEEFRAALLAGDAAAAERTARAMHLVD